MLIARFQVQVTDCICIALMGERDQLGNRKTTGRAAERRTWQTAPDESECVTLVINLLSGHCAASGMWDSTKS